MQLGRLCQTASMLQTILDFHMPVYAARGGENKNQKKKERKKETAYEHERERKGEKERERVREKEGQGMIVCRWRMGVEKSTALPNGPLSSLDEVPLLALSTSYRPRTYT